MKEAATHVKRELDYYEDQDNPQPKRPCLGVPSNLDSHSSSLPASWGHFGFQDAPESELLGLAQLGYSNEPNYLSIGHLLDQEQCQPFRSDNEFSLDQTIGFDPSHLDWSTLNTQEINPSVTLPESLLTYSLDTGHYESGTLIQTQATGASKSTICFETQVSTSTPPEFGPIAGALHFPPSPAVEWEYQPESQDNSKKQTIKSPNYDSPCIENGETLCNLETGSDLLSLVDFGGGSELDSRSDSADSKFDTCFGVLPTTPVISIKSIVVDKPVEMTLKPSGTILKIYRGGTDKYVGLLDVPEIQDLLAGYSIRLRSFLSKAKTDGSGTKVKIENGDERLLPEYSLRVVVFGQLEDITVVGNFLSTANLYLQHPSQTECGSNIEYFNPHYLVRLGGEMPKIEDLSLEDDEERGNARNTVDDVAKCRLLRLFDDADGTDLEFDVQPSPRLRANLMEHQVQALSIMLEKESGRLNNPKAPSLWSPVIDGSKAGMYRHTITGTILEIPDIVCGGVIADEMGLGKTLSTLALICSRLDMLQSANSADQESRATLIVTPKSTLYGWQQQINRHIHPGQIKSFVYHGSSRDRLSSQFDNTDVVLTTYETLRSDHVLQGPLYSSSWLRLVLDEAHHIRNRESRVFAACCQVRAQHRWCLTGTPVQNSLDDYGALLAFLRVSPFQDKRQFNRWIARPFKNSSFDALGTLRQLVAATCVRRTKAKCNLSTPLPPRYEEVEEVDLHPEEQEMYDFFKEYIQSIVIPTSQNSSTPVPKPPKSPNILSLITVLRVICDHVGLIPQAALDSWTRRDTSNATKDASFLLTPASKEYTEDEATGMSPSPPQSTIEDTSTGGDFRPGQHGALGLTQDKGSDESKSDNNAGSAKIDALLKKLRAQQSGSATCKPSKSVIFSSWTRMLDKVGRALHAAGFNYQRIDGQSSLKSRAETMKIFSEDSSCTVMLASMGSAGEGVDFTAAQHIHILEPHWNPMAEAQAVDRVHRIGQTLPVTITRYIVPRSIETYIQWVQNDKLRMIKLSLDSIEDAELIEKRRLKKLMTFLQ